jgi:nitrate/TMAO reductase-like tetraheme cytochrome c subunit
MAENSSDGVTPEPRKGLFGFLKRQPQCSIGRMLVVGILGGIMIWGGLNMGMEYTNRSDFCMSCHEMTIPFEELKKTVHYKNRSGTTVQCADCHVASSKTPTDYIFKSFQKLMAARDVIGHIKGTLDTPEKYEAHRLAMAERVWERMKDRDSKECRNCHDFKTMDPAKQKDQVGDQTRRRDRRWQDLHRLPQGHRAQAGPSEEGPGASSASCRAAGATGQPAPAKAEDKPAVRRRHRPGRRCGHHRAGHRRHDRDDNGGDRRGTRLPRPRRQTVAASDQAAKAEAAPAAGGVTALDWSKVPTRQIKVFYPGQAGLEWIMNKADHSSAADIVEKKRACAKCHEGDANEVGTAIVTGKPVGVSKTVMEPNRPPARSASSRDLPGHP